MPMNVVAHERRLISLRQAAWQLDMHPTTLRRLVAEGRVPAVRSGRRGWYRVRADVVREIADGTRTW
jgi:excisionase family DNA binding protein